MQQVKKVADNLYWVGANDRRISLFENLFPVPRGVSYNSYLLLDEKTVLFDTVDKGSSAVFNENIDYLLKERKLDYIVINHVEPDHSANLGELLCRYPNVKIVGNKWTATILKQFFDFERWHYDFDSGFICVKEGDKLSSGTHELNFVMSPMVHWPEVMVTYDSTAKILFSADAFGTFGALNGHIFADEVDFERDWLPEARRYYSNIVGKYGNQVQALLAKAAKLDIEMLCPLHGLVWRKDIPWYVEKYQRWSAYVPEETAVMIAYASIHGGTENAVNILAANLAEKGVRNIGIYDVSSTHPGDIVAEAFRCSHLVFASATYNAGIFSRMENILHELAEHNVQNRTVALIENGSWAPESGRLMRGIFESMKKITILDNVVSIKSSVKAEHSAALEKLADTIFKSMPFSSIPSRKLKQAEIQNDTFFKLSYGLFILSAKDGGKDNACIINTVIQITDTPKRIVFAVNQMNYTHDIIMKTGIINVSILSMDTPFSLFQRYGFHSGRDTDKYAGLNVQRSVNGLIYEDKYANGFISGRVFSTSGWGTHTLFVAEVTEAVALSNTPALTYQYYFDHIKPKPPITGEKKKGYVCKICGYIHEGDELPPDFICPLCKHGAADFEKLA